MHRFLSATCVVALIAALACRDGSGPDGIRLILSANVIGPSQIDDAGDFPVVGCTLDLRGDSRGSGRAVWHGGVIRFYLGGNRSEVADSARIPGETVRAAWGSDTLVAGTDVHSEWTISHVFPFEAEFEVQFRPVPGSEIARASAFARCGSPLDPASTPPEVDAVAVMTTGPAEPGDSVTIEYSARSGPGLRPAPASHRRHAPIRPTGSPIARAPR
jgi:hypothetical protein